MQRARLDGSGFVPGVIIIVVGAIYIGGEHIFQFVATIPKPAVELNVISARSHIRQGKDHCGVLHLSVHALACAIGDTFTIGVECTYLQIAQAQGFLCGGGECDRTLVGHLYLKPIHLVGSKIAIS